MNKVCGNRQDYIPVKQDESRYIISYGLEEAPNDLYTWYEIYIYKKQKSTISLQDVEDAITDDINDRVTENIITGYRWTVLHGEDEGLLANVWLSAENQANFKAKHDTALQYPNLVSWPMQYKIGEKEERTEDEETHMEIVTKRPVYEYFQNIQELASFYLGGVDYIESCYQAGWAEKDAMDWKPYEDYFKPSEE